jgi:DNA-binding MarR family transcriptional regulator
MTYLIDELVDAQVVERRPDPTDRRAYQIVATDRGRRLLPELDRRLDAVEQHVLSGLARNDAERFRELLRRAVNELDRLDHVDDLTDVRAEMSPPRRRSR